MVIKGIIYYDLAIASSQRVILSEVTKKEYNCCRPMFPCDVVELFGRRGTSRAKSDERSIGGVRKGSTSSYCYPFCD